jgi:glutathione peroxidase
MASVYDIPVRTLAGADSSLGQFNDKVVLIVNVASKCGLTPQYEGLESLYKKYKDRGFVIAGFPSNDFAGQEPGTADEIQSFCSLNYGVDFPLFEKIPVVGPQKHPLYAALIGAKPESVATGDHPFADDLIKFGVNPNAPPEVLWNFEKFLLDRGGNVVARFAPDTKPDDPKLVAAVEAELDK